MSNFETKYEKAIDKEIKDIIKAQGLDGFTPDVLKSTVKKHILRKQGVCLDDILDRLVTQAFNQ